MKKQKRKSIATFLATGMVGLLLVGFPQAAHADEPALVTNPVDHVDTLNGTGTGGETVGSINNFPGAAVPFGMVQYSPDTAGNYAGYHHDNERSTGFSMTHASVGCNAFGDIPMLPTTSPIGQAPWNAWEKIAHDDSEIGQPGYYTVKFPDTGVTAELTATTRTGLGRFSYPNDGRPALFHIRTGGSLAGNSAAQIEIGSDGKTVTGSATTGRFCGKNNSYAVYFAMEFSQPFSSFGTWDGNSVAAGSATANSSRSGGYVEFASGSTVEVRTALSYVDVNGAKANLAAEENTDFDGVRAAAADEWNTALAKIAVAGTDEDDLETFYTSLYRSLLHPNTFNDADGSYRGFDDKIHQLPDGHTQYANFSDWDTYRSLAPLQGMLFPEQASDMAQSLVNDAEQSGSYPRWALANSATGQMTGDNVVPLIANLYAYGAKDFDLATALKYMVSGATEGGVGLNGYVERPGIKTYLENGYAPQVEDFRADHRIAGASITLEWSVDDFAISQFAASLGETTTSDEFQTRSQYWQNLFNPTTKFISPRSSTGAFPDGPGFVEPTSGFGQDGFDEGNAEQYLWWVPQNMAGLVTAIGGRDAAANRLDAFATEINAGANKPYLWSGNEPNFGVPWLYNYVGQPWKTQELVNRVRTELFGPTPDGEPGNDDLGAQSSWFVWAALGMYPATPGMSSLTVNTPLFDRAEIALADGKSISVAARGASGPNGLKYIDALSIDGSATDSTALPQSIVDTGGNITFSLAANPNTSWGAAVESAPPSFPAGSSTVTVNASPATAVVAPGSTRQVALDLQRMIGASADFAVDAASATAGITATSLKGQFAADGSAHGELAVTVAASVPDGYYPVNLTTTVGDATRSTTVLIAVTQPNGLAANYNVVGTAFEHNAGVANFDAAGNSYSREQLATQGLTPGAVVAVNETTFRWPSSPEGVPDTVIPAGQTVSVPNSPTTLSFVGASRDGGSEGDATVTFDDGTTAVVRVGLGDWVLPSGDGTAVYGNSIVAKMAERNANSAVHGAYVYATAPYTAPAGRTIVSVTLPKQDRMRIFALSTNGVAPTAAETAISLTASSVNPKEGTTFELDAVVNPISATGTVTFFDGDNSIAEVAVGSTGSTAGLSADGVVVATAVPGHAKLELTATGVGEHGYWAKYTPSSSDLFSGSESLKTVVTVAKANDGSVDPTNTAPPTTVPPTTVPPTTVPSTTLPSTTGPAGGGGTTGPAAGSPSQLSATGAQPLPWLLGGVVISLLGSAAVMAIRRRDAV